MTQSDRIEDLFEIINDLEIGMLVSEDGNKLRSRPMKAFVDQKARNRPHCLCDMRDAFHRRILGRRIKRG